MLCDIDIFAMNTIRVFNEKIENTSTYYVELL